MQLSVALTVATVVFSFWSPSEAVKIGRIDKAKMNKALQAVKKARTVANTHPIAQVISLIKDLKKKADDEGHSDEVTYTDFKRWCASTTKQFQEDVKASGAKIETLTDEVASAKEEEDRLNAQIKALKDEIAGIESADDKASKIATDARNNWVEADKDLKDTVAAIEGALDGLKDATPIEESLLEQKRSKALRVAAHAFIQAGIVATERQKRILRIHDDPEKSAEEEEMKSYGSHSEAYSSKTGAVLEMLEELQDQLKQKRSKLLQEETRRQLHAKAQEHDLAGRKTAAVDSKSTKESRLGEVEGSKATAEQDLNVEKDAEADAERDLDDTSKECKQKAREYAENTATRDSEMKAMDQAIKILSKSLNVRAAPEAEAEATLTQLKAIPKGNQIGTSNSVDKAAKLLRDAAKSTHSVALQALAKEITSFRSKKGTFDAVMNEIEKMINHLRDEQTDEAKHKLWCDSELAKTNTSKDHKEDKIGSLKQKISELTALETNLQDKIATAADEQSKTEKELAEAAELRKMEVADQKVSIKDANEAQEALAKASAVLTQFYKDSVQDPESADNTRYTGVEGSSSLLELLETVSANYAKMEADTRAKSTEDQQTYNDEQLRLETLISKLTATVQQTKLRLEKITDQVKEKRTLLKAKAKGLETVEQYLKDLEKPCLEGDSSFEDRQADRQKEIEALLEAKDELANAFEESASPSPTPASA
mmetsp:Transcript_53177/g.119881  ORF Transcript_53177/g.119881 Transcript_53177/m.119881 type:complete len:713 (+) Transcript_53177:81-2219(+)|eukprot:CAMPEP_0197890540 /NCGR_PEP_ID=MMETSP1439-20131203/27072_1 /TAXON_ID=66791 /ORGANISM="Gonyaulax spinifera, Strain CCMP409" /LENGTH=712 /DNA_ID=CAMNT_0043510589 /DNA_START=75 /DNA_END=2213 /DNA_ORIENTATION=-